MPSVGDAPSVSDHTLSRRRVLATVAAVATGGCLDAGTSGPGATAADTDAPPSEADPTDSTNSTDSTDPTGSADPTSTRSASATPPRADVGPDWPAPDATTTPGYGAEPTATAAVGDPERRPSGMEPHGVVVRNAAGGTATADDTTTTDGAATRITTRVWRDGTRVLARTDPLATGEFLRVTLREPGGYLVAVRAAPDRRGVVVSNRDRTWFDCNASTTTVEARPEGYARGYITTSLACVTPE